MANVYQEFQSAPMGRRTILPLVSAIFCVVIFVTVNGFVMSPSGHRPTPESRLIIALAPLVGLVFAVPMFYVERSRVSRFSITENSLVLLKKSYPLTGLVSVERDPKIMCWAFKTRGNGGLGAIRGRFWSKRVGKFDAFLTGTENAVVLRWPDRTVAVSPADPDFFITCAKSAAGLR
jgi:Bacterial PH domain